MVSLPTSLHGLQQPAWLLLTWLLLVLLLLLLLLLLTVTYNLQRL
jgi:hypothetical protein